MGKVVFDKKLVKKIADLARLRIINSDVEYFTRQFNETIKVVDGLNKLDTSKVTTTYTVTGLENITRGDIVDKKRMLSQNDALLNANRKHEGYFVVKGVLDEK